MGIAAEVVVKVRRHDGDEAEEHAWPTASKDLLASAVPWRVFRWRRGQKHCSGTYWSATMRDHAIYEPRLELARLLFADFDRSVHGIVAQPFLLQTVLKGKIRKHIPDYFLLTDQVPVIVDVKPLAPPVQARGRVHLRLDPAGGGSAWWHWSYGDRYWALMTGADAAHYRPKEMGSA